MGGTNSISDQNIIICGHEDCGKTLFLKKLIDLTKKIGDSIQTDPTFGYNYITYHYSNRSYHIWDLGGDNISRQYWSAFYRNIQVHILIYIINLYDSEENQIESIKSFIELANEEELKQTKVFLIFNQKMDKSKKGSTKENNKDNDEDKLKVSYLNNIIQECQVHDFDNRVSHFICDISKIKKGELKTTEILNKCFMIPDKEV